MSSIVNSMQLLYQAHVFPFHFKCLSRVPDISAAQGGRDMPTADSLLMTAAATTRATTVTTTMTVTITTITTMTATTTTKATTTTMTTLEPTHAS